MALFGLFGSKDSSVEKETKNIPWERLIRMEQLEEISIISKSKPVAIFKHSSRCGVSSMVLRQFESAYDLEPSQMKLYFLDLLSYRDISNEVGIRFQVYHQSPQLIVVKNEVAVHHSSHHNVSAGVLSKFV